MSMLTRHSQLVTSMWLPRQSCIALQSRLFIKVGFRGMRTYSPIIQLQSTAPMLHHSFQTSITSTDSLEHQNEMIQQLIRDGDLVQAWSIFTSMQGQSLNVDKGYPDAAARASVVRAWLDSAKEGDDDITYHATDQATEILLRWRDDATKFENKLVPPTIQDYNSILFSWVKIPHVRGVPQRAQRILEIMASDQHLSPTIDSFNYVLQSWSRSREHMRGTMAQTLFQKLTNTVTDMNYKKKDVVPNGASYRAMIYAWAHSGEMKAAFRATGHLMKLLRFVEQSEGQADQKPEMEDYYLIFDAWTKARDKHAAEKSFNVLRLMEYAYINRFSELRADIRVIRSILKAYARSESSPDLGRDVDQLLEKVWDRNLVPDTDCFSFAIQTHVNCALHKDLVDDPTPMAVRAHQLLKEMILAVQKSEGVKVSTENYNQVLKAFTANVQLADEKSLALLESMEDSASLARPNAATYALTINVLAKSRTKKDKVALSQQLIERAQREYDRGNKSAKPDTFMYNALIRVCASSTNGTTVKQRMASFRLALQTLPRCIYGNQLEPDPETFLCLLEASHSLLAPGVMQANAMEQIFTTCCRSGLLDHIILKRFQELAPPDLFRKLVVEKSKFDNDGTRVVPLSWTANVTTKGLIFDRKKAPALDVNGNFFTTSQMKDRRMRRLRVRHNQKILQGGRLPKVEQSREDQVDSMKV